MQDAFISLQFQLLLLFVFNSDMKKIIIFDGTVREFKVKYVPKTGVKYK